MGTPKRFTMCSHYTFGMCKRDGTTFAVSPFENEFKNDMNPLFGNFCLSMSNCILEQQSLAYVL